MKTLVVYYSLEGNTAYAAERIAAANGADLLSLVPKKAYTDKGPAKFLRGGFHAVRGKTPKLENYTVDLAQYEQVIFGFPVWAAHVTPPIRTFVEEQKDALAGKSFAVFACEAGNGAESAFENLRELLEIEAFDKTGIFIEPKKQQNAETDAAIDAFANA